MFVVNAEKDRGQGPFDLTEQGLISILRGRIWSNKSWSHGRWVRPQPPLPVYVAGYRWTAKRTWQCDHSHCLKPDSMTLTASFIAFNSSSDISCYRPQTTYVQKLIHRISSLKCPHLGNINHCPFFGPISPKSESFFIPVLSPNIQSTHSMDFAS